MPTTVPASSLDIVGVFNSNLTQVFMNARPISANVRPTAKIMDHPLETGQIISDYKVILPLDIELRLILPSPFLRDLYEEIWNLWTTSELLTVQTKAKSYANMVIAEPPHEEKPDFFDALPLTIRLRQAQLVPAVSMFAPADPAQADTQNLGDQNAYAVTGTKNATTGDTTFSSIPPQRPAYTLNGVQTIGGTTSIPAQQSILSPSSPSFTGIQSMTSGQTIASGFN